MATGDNPLIPLFEPGSRVTAAITAPVNSGTFVRPSASFQGGPPLSLNSALTGGNLMQVATCGAGQRAFGVAVTDGALATDVIPVICGHDTVIPMIAGAAIAIGVELESDATGRAVTLAAGRANGMAVSTASIAGAIVYVRLY